MQFNQIIVALMATFAMASAMPAGDNGGLVQRSCPNGWDFCGTCNGASCKVGGSNYDCESGTSCTSQSGGGDGKACGGSQVPIPFASKYTCPGKN